MKTARHMIFLMILGLIAAAFCEPEEITLQNGLNQYNGCEDAYFTCTSPSTNYGNEKVLKIKCEGG